MSLSIAYNLPVIDELVADKRFKRSEDIDKLDLSQHSFPELNILIVNLMPNKVETEKQLLELLGKDNYLVHIDFLYTKSHSFKNKSSSHVFSSYHTLDEIRNNYYDGMIVTGAPLENIDFHDVDYWQELKEIFLWADEHARSKIYICWAAQAALYHKFGIEKYPLEKKLSGIYPHKLSKIGEKSKLFQSFDQVFMAPHSRYTYTKLEDVKKVKDLEVLSYSDQAGLYIAYEEKTKSLFITGHPEYDKDSLSKEYERDLKKGINPQIPFNYYEDNDPSKKPLFTWKAHASLLYLNWLSSLVNRPSKERKSKILGERKKVVLHPLEREDLEKSPQVIALLGYGVVGKGVYDILSKRDDLVIKYVYDLKSFHELANVQVDSYDKIINDQEVDTIIEVIGGDDVAYNLVKKALEHKKNVVSANKKMIAKYFVSLHELAKKEKVQFKYSASVGGGIPWLDNLYRYKLVSKVSKVQGIVNGTCNYILTLMDRLDYSFKDSLSLAQEKGYAEVDPHLDISGKDSRDKILISASIAFDAKIDFDSVLFRGIESVKKLDVENAKKRGSTIKLLAQAFKKDDEINIFVEPVFVNTHSLEAQVAGNHNIISCYDEYKDKVSFYGQGAGRYPTAANIAGDLIQIDKEKKDNSLDLKDYRVQNNIKRAYYIRCERDDFIESIADETHSDYYITKPIELFKIHQWAKDKKDIFFAGLKEEEDFS